jgi:hypothetical protein
VAQAKPIAASCEEQSCRIVLLLNKGQELLLADASKAAIMSGTERCGPWSAMGSSTPLSPVA